jgi:hypothetical protein
MSGKKSSMPEHIWVVLEHHPATTTITVLAFQMGTRDAAIKVGGERAKPQEGGGSVEAFDLLSPPERLRYHMELWLVGEGVAADEARKIVIELAKSMRKELKSLRKRRPR